MKIFIEVDLEGVAGIVSPPQVKPGDPAYPDSCRKAVAEANACIEGCFRGGATAVTVWDAHCHGVNLSWLDLDPRADLVQGTSDHGRMHDVGDYDAVVLLGFHAMAGAPGAILEHTMSSAGWQNCWLNGRPAGEFAIDAAIAGDAGVPVIMTSGDDKLCAEARSWIPGVHAAQTKVGYASGGGRLLGRAAAQRLVAETAERACREGRAIQPLRVGSPVTLRLELTERGRLPGRGANLPHLRQIDGRTYEVTGANVREALARL